MSTRFALAAFLAAIVAIPLMAQVQKQEIAGIRNYSRVDATVGCGGAVDPAAMTALQERRLRLGDQPAAGHEEGANVEAGRAAAQAAGLKYIHLPFNAAMPDPKVVDSFLAAVADKSNQPVFIHCGSANRVGGVWMIKRALQDKWPLERALTEAQAIGLNNPALQAFATDYIKRPASHRRIDESGIGVRIRIARHGSAIPPPRPRARRLDRGLPRGVRALPGSAARRARRRSPGAARRSPRAWRAVRRHLRGLRAGPRPGADALEPSGLLRLLRDHRQRARRARGVSLRRAQPAGDAVAHVAGGDRARRGRARLAARPDGPARRRSKASSTTRRRSRRCTRWPPRARRRFPASASAGLAGRSAAASASTAPSRRIRRSTRRSSCSGSAIRRCARSRSTISSGCGAEALRAAIAEDRAAGIQPIAVVATIGTTSTTSVDPVADDRRHLPRAKASGCTSTPRTPASRPSSRVPRARSTAGRAPTPSSSIRTSGCSRRSISARSTAGAWMSCARRFRSCRST